MKYTITCCDPHSESCLKSPAHMKTSDSILWSLSGVSEAFLVIARAAIKILPNTAKTLFRRLNKQFPWQTVATKCLTNTTFGQPCPHDGYGVQYDYDIFAYGVNKNNHKPSIGTVCLTAVVSVCLSVCLFVVYLPTLFQCLKVFVLYVPTLFQWLKVCLYFI
jgi:hypothetical protein